MYNNPASKKVAGMVTIHVINNLLTVLQLTSLAPPERPTPMIDDESICVVLTGNFNRVALNIMEALHKSAENPPGGSMKVICVPTVCIILHPPIAVPIAIAVAANTFTHSAISMDD